MHISVHVRKKLIGHKNANHGTINVIFDVLAIDLSVFLILRSQVFR